MKQICEIPKNPVCAAVSLKWLTVHIEQYSLVYKHHNLNAYAWGGLQNSPGGIWHAALVAFNSPRDADRFEQFRSRCVVSYDGLAGASLATDEGMQSD